MTKKALDYKHKVNLKIPPVLRRPMASFPPSSSSSSSLVNLSIGIYSGVPHAMGRGCLICVYVRALLTVEKAMSCFTFATLAVLCFPEMEIKTAYIVVDSAFLSIWCGRRSGLPDVLRSLQTVCEVALRLQVVRQSSG